MTRLALHGAGDVYRDRARAVLWQFSGDLSSYGVHGVEAALAIEETLREPLRIRISGDPADPATRALRRAALNVAWPWTVVLSGEPSGPAMAEVSRETRSRTVVDARDLTEAADAVAEGRQP
jgi:uncharacterized protein YyaL (SSP411 family)